VIRPAVASIRLVCGHCWRTLDHFETDGPGALTMWAPNTDDQARNTRPISSTQKPSSRRFYSGPGNNLWARRTYACHPTRCRAQYVDRMDRLLKVIADASGRGRNELVAGVDL
jgi:hypothetical protein